MLHRKVYVKSSISTHSLSPFANLTKLKKHNFSYVVLRFVKPTNIDVTFLQKPEYLRKYPTQRFDLWVEDRQDIWGYNGTIA